MSRFDKKELTAKLEEIFVSEMPVRFQDIDAAGIVFFARFFDFVHGAYEDFMAEAQQSLSDALASRLWAAPLMHVEADYFAPISYGDVVRVRMVAAIVEPQVIHLGWCLEKRSKDGSTRTCAALQTSHAFVSLPEFKRISVPAGVVRALGAQAAHGE